MKHLYKLRLDTMTDVKDFVNIASQFENLKLTDTENYTINASSILGVMYSLEWNNIYLMTDRDLYSYFDKFIINTSTRD